MAGLGELFAQTEAQYGLPAGYLSRTAQIESGGDPRAQNPASSAGGLFQFIDSTAQQYGLADRFDPMQATDAAGRLARDNMASLASALGRSPTAAELYLAHQQGAGGAAKLLANPDASAASLVGGAAAGLNGGKEGQTAGGFANHWIEKFGGASTGGMTGATGAAPGAQPLALTFGPIGDGPAAPVLGQVATGWAQEQQAKQQARQAEDQARRTALFGGGLGALYG